MGRLLRLRDRIRFPAFEASRVWLYGPVIGLLLSHAPRVLAEPSSSASSNGTGRMPCAAKGVVWSRAICPSACDPLSSGDALYGRYTVVGGSARGILASLSLLVALRVVVIQRCSSYWWWYLIRVIPHRGDGCTNHLLV